MGLTKNLIEPGDFLQTVLGPLRRGDVAGLAASVLGRWTSRDVSRLLQAFEVDVRRVAAVTLGLIGDRKVVPALAKALHDVDAQVNQMAEYSLWSIWFRSGLPEATKTFLRGVALIEQERYQDAIEPFEDAYHIDPGFAEAYNQCSIAHYYLGQWEESLEDCRETLRREPLHFAAMAGIGHCYAEMEHLDLALEYYRRAVAINPRMPVIQSAISSIESCPRIKIKAASVDSLGAN
ncbi:MAG: tetratricopeptide repeat protein [Phycisphaeraceae bacterium]|nr:tetratricopeptide repeat protein [Phycisphaeraceae bacterium]